MPFIRLFPNGTVSNDIPGSGMVGGGAIPAHTLLGDLSPYTYMRTVNGAAGTLTRLDLSSYTLQSNELVDAVRVGMVQSHTHPLGVYALINNHGAMGAGIWAPVPAIDVTKPDPPVFYSQWYNKNAVDGTTWDQTDLNNMQLYVIWPNPGGTFEARLHDIWVDIYVQPLPVAVNVSPASSEVINTDIPTFAWMIPAVDGRPFSQEQYSLKIWEAGVVEGVGFDPDTSTTYAEVPLWNTSIRASGPYGPPELAAVNPRLIYGANYYWAVKVRTYFPPGPSRWSEWSTPTKFRATTKPFADIIEPTGVVTTNFPFIVWENADPEGDPQVGFEIRVYERPGASWAGFDVNNPAYVPMWSTIGSDRTTFRVQMTNPIRDNKTYRVYIRTAQRTYETLDWGPNIQPFAILRPGPVLWGGWVNEEITTDFIEPDAPELAIALFEDRLQLTVTPGTEPAPVDIDYYVIDRSLDGGETWSTFKQGVGDEDTSEIDDFTTTFTVTDHHVPAFTEVLYRAYSVSTDLGPGFEMASAYSNIVVGYIETDNIWIKDTGDHENNAHFPYQDEWIQRTTNRVRGIYTPLGRSKHIVVRGQNNSDSFAVTLLIEGSELKQKIENIVKSNRTLFLISPKGSWYLDISGPVNWRDRMGDRRQGQDDIWTVTIPFVEVDPNDV